MTHLVKYNHVHSILSILWSYKYMEPRSTE